MKKFLAVLLSLVMAFSFCLPAFAEDTTASGGRTGDILGGITLPDVDISGAADTIKQLVGIIINSNGKMDEAVIAEIITITDVNKGIITRCLALERKDFEDSVQYESALLQQVDVIVTRNVKDFKDFAENVQTPADFLESVLD